MIGSDPGQRASTILWARLVLVCRPRAVVGSLGTSCRAIYMAFTGENGDVPTNEGAASGRVGNDAPATPQATYHFPITNLRLPAEIQIGEVRFRPKEALVRLAAADDSPASQAWLQFRPRLLEVIESNEWATADLSAPDDKHALAQVKDALAVLRLYQRRRYRYVNLERQTFGLSWDIGARRQDWWKTKGSRVVGAGGSWTGVNADWTFADKDLQEVAQDPVVTALDQWLRVPEAHLSNLQARALGALRYFDRASTVMLPDDVRIVTLATGIEGLLGDSEQSGRTHRMALRAAFLGCVLDGVRHGPERLCPYFALLDARAFSARMREENERGRPFYCSAYWWVRELQSDRNAALHDACRDFPERRAGHHSWVMDGVFEGFALFVAQDTGARTMDDLDHALAKAANLDARG